VCSRRVVTAAGRGSFTAAIELRKQRQLVISFLYHMAVQRNVRNPFETQEVVGASCLRIYADSQACAPTSTCSSPDRPC